MLDESLKLYDATVNANSNGFNVQSGAWVNLGRNLPLGAQLYFSAQEIGVDRDLACDLEMRIDNSTGRVVSRVTIPKGKRQVLVQGIDSDFQAQEYLGSNIDVRVNITATNHANANNFGKVVAYLTSGEASIL